MAWDIEFTDEFGEWFRNLDDAEKVSVTASVDLLEELGPALGRPHVDTLKGLPVPNMKELRVQQAGKPYRHPVRVRPSADGNPADWPAQRGEGLVPQDDCSRGEVVCEISHGIEERGVALNAKQVA